MAVDAAALTVQAAVGLTSGVLGAVAGAGAQRFLDRRHRREALRSALWQFERQLRFEAEHLEGELIHVPQRSKPEKDDLENARTDAAQYYDDLPRQIRQVIDADSVAVDHRGDLMVVVNDLSERAQTLRAFLQGHSTAVEE